VVDWLGWLMLHVAVVVVRCPIFVFVGSFSNV
jgi:hypothetical protein